MRRSVHVSGGCSRGRSWHGYSCGCSQHRPRVGGGLHPSLPAKILLETVPTTHSSNNHNCKLLEITRYKKLRGQGGVFSPHYVWVHMYMLWLAAQCAYVCEPRFPLSGAAAAACIQPQRDPFTPASHFQCTALCTPYSTSWSCIATDVHVQLTRADVTMPNRPGHLGRGGNYRWGGILSLCC